MGKNKILVTIISHIIFDHRPNTTRLGAGVLIMTPDFVWTKFIDSRRQFFKKRELCITVERSLKMCLCMRYRCMWQKKIDSPVLLSASLKAMFSSMTLSDTPFWLREYSTMFRVAAPPVNSVPSEGQSSDSSTRNTAWSVRQKGSSCLSLQYDYLKKSIFGLD